MSLLIVIEGPDFVGKTTVAQLVSSEITDRGIDNIQLSFPGHKDGTLGKIIYELHHNLNKYGIQNINSVSLQLLHVAAHIDSIEKDILPALSNNTSVILDRYWWSTYVYGAVDGIGQDYLERLIAIEELAWKNITPDFIILIDADKPFGIEITNKWDRLRKVYKKIYQRKKNDNNVFLLKNDSTMQDLANKIIQLVN